MVWFWTRCDPDSLSFWCFSCVTSQIQRGSRLQQHFTREPPFQADHSLSLSTRMPLPLEHQRGPLTEVCHRSVLCGISLFQPQNAHQSQLCPKSSVALLFRENELGKNLSKGSQPCQFCLTSRPGSLVVWPSVIQCSVPLRPHKPPRPARSSHPRPHNPPRPAWSSHTPDPTTH